MNRIVLRNYQRDAYRYGVKQKNPIYFVDMRLGKTIVAIRVVKSWQNCSLVLVVAPYSALYGWKEQLITASEQVTELYGSRVNRLSLLSNLLSCPSQRQWVLINKEGHLVVPEIAGMKFDCVIIDESTFIKSPIGYNVRMIDGKKIKRPNISRFYVEGFSSVQYKILLTGTPAPETELDYYTQFQFVGENLLGCSNYYAFRNKHFREFCHKWVMNKSSRVQLAAYLSKRCFMLDRENSGIAYTTKEYVTRAVELPLPLRKIYDTAEVEFLLEVEGKVIDKTMSTGKRFVWLRALTGGWLSKYADGYDFDYKGKLQELHSLLIGDLKNEKVIIWSYYKKEINAIIDYLKSNGIYSLALHGQVKQVDRLQSITQFKNDEKTRCLICQPECFRHGIDLSPATAAIYFSTPLSKETRQQSEDRIVRVGKSGIRLIIDIIVRYTVDEDAIKILKRKGKKINYMKELINAAIQRRSIR